MCVLYRSERHRTLPESVCLREVAMKISDLDLEIKNVVACAHIVGDYPTDANLARLKKVVKVFDDKHAEERAQNLIRALSNLEET